MSERMTWIEKIEANKNCPMCKAYLKHLSSWDDEIGKLEAENKVLKESKQYICAGAKGTQPVNECCGGCYGCIEMQMSHSINELAAENKVLKEALNEIAAGIDNNAAMLALSSLKPEFLNDHEINME